MKWLSSSLPSVRMGKVAFAMTETQPSCVLSLFVCLCRRNRGNRIKWNGIINWTKRWGKETNHKCWNNLQWQRQERKKYRKKKNYFRKKKEIISNDKLCIYLSKSQMTLTLLTCCWLCYDVVCVWCVYSFVIYFMFLCGVMHIIVASSKVFSSSSKEVCVDV